MKIFCRKCGTRLNKRDKFCPKCGAPADMAAAGNGLPENAPEGKSQSGKARWLLILIIVLMLGILGCVAAGSVLVYTGGLEDLPLPGGSRAEKTAEQESEKKHTDQEDADGKDDAQENDDAKDGERKDDDAEDENGKDEAFAGEHASVSIRVRQVDNTGFPNIACYVTVTDEEGEVVEELTEEDFVISEINTAGEVSKVDIDRVEQVIHSDRISIDMVMDASGSMDSAQKMSRAKEACAAFMNEMNLDRGDQVEIISFDSYVYLQQYFTSQYESLQTALDGIETDGSTALYDALYVGLLETYNQPGAKCVIAFTDGMENASSYTFEDVVGLAQSTGIPVYIIGIGQEPDASILGDLANQCYGGYYPADETELETILRDVYTGIYREQQGSYVLQYTTEDLSETDKFREIQLEMSETSGLSGEYRKEYVPVSDLTGGFSADYADMDFMIEDSGSRTVTEADLQDMSLAELRIARNEIFARYGRQFIDSMLNKWFYSKQWYMNISDKYSPEEFDALPSDPMSKLERNNVEFILAYEQNLMANGDIYPDADTEELSEYDLALSKPVLKQALAQMQEYPDTDILQQNIIKVQEAIDKEDILY